MGRLFPRVTRMNLYVVENEIVYSIIIDRNKSYPFEIDNSKRKSAFIQSILL